MERCKLSHSDSALTYLAHIKVTPLSNTHIILPADKQDPVAVPACMAVGKCQAILVSSKKSASGKQYLRPELACCALASCTRLLVKGRHNQM